MQEVGKVNGEYFSSSDSGSSLVSGENLSSSNYTSSSGLGDEEVAEALTRDVHIEQSGLILVHHPVDPYVGLPNHCPSFGSVQDFMYADCDCIAKHHLAECCQTTEPPYAFLNTIDFDLQAALDGERTVDDKDNNLRRKDLYRSAFFV